MGKCPFELSPGGFTELTCRQESGGYSFTVITATPTPDQIKRMCASETCKSIIAAVRAKQPDECNTGGTMWDFYLYKDILNPIAAGCGAAPPATPPAPPPTSPPAPPPTTRSPPATTAPPPATTSPSTPSTGGTTNSDTSNEGTTNSGTSTDGTTDSGASNDQTSDASNGATAAPTSGGSANATAAPNSSGTGSASATPGASNGTWTSSPVSSPIASSKNSTNASTINTTKTDASDGSNSTMIIAIVAGVVVVIALVAFLAFRAGKRKVESPPEPSYVVVATTTKSNSTAAASRPAPHGNYVPSPLTGTRSSEPVTRSSGAITRSGARSPAYLLNSVGSGVAATGANIGLWTDRAIEKTRIPLEEILMGDVLSKGAFGEVLRGSYNGEAVAIKRLLPERRKDMKEIESFLEEAKLLTSLRHQRVVQFVGVAWDSLTDLCVVTELMDGGDLRSLLTHADANNEPTGFDANKVKIALHIVHALSYLHGLKPIVVHRDLKSKNVLLTRDLDAKLTDFGVSRERADATMTAGVGSSLWMAPEVMLGERYDEKADIFSFGVLLSELDTQKLPYSHAKEPGTDRQIPEMAMLNMVSSGKLTVTFSEGADPDMVATGRACVALDPTERPTANEVFHRMHHIYRNYRQI